MIIKELQGCNSEWPDFVEFQPILLIFFKNHHNGARKKNPEPLLKNLWKSQKSNSSRARKKSPQPLIIISFSYHPTPYFQHPDPPMPLQPLLRFVATFTKSVFEL
jgi:hypothetical protein